MKSQIFKLIAFIALLTIGGFSSTAQNNGSALSSINNPVSSSTAFTIDKNIISFAVDKLVDKIIYEHAPYPNYGGFPEAWSPHEWSITLIMAEGTDVTSLAPIITLSPCATITSKHANVQDFSQQVVYTVICDDGSTVTYSFLAYVQNNTRAQGWITIYCSPINGGYTSPSGTSFHDDTYLFCCTAYPNSSYSFGYWSGNAAGTNNVFCGFLNLNYGTWITANFVSNMQYTVTVQSEDTNKGTVSGGGTVPYGGSVSVSASAKSGYIFEGWYLNGSKISSSASFSYQPSATCTIIAKFTAAPVISGYSTICSGSSKSFSASNWVQGDYYWDKNSNLSLSSPTTNSTVTVSPASSSSKGLGYVYVKNSGGTILATYILWIGPPEILSISGQTYVMLDNAYGLSYYAQNVSGSPTSYDWRLNNSTNYVSNYGYYSIIYYTYEGSFSVSSRGTNSCGDGAWVYLQPITIYSYSPSPAFPNPASDVLNIEVGQTDAAKANGKDYTYDVRLYDEQGNLLRQTTTKSGTVQFNVSNLPVGIYFLHTYDGVNSKPEIQQILVDH